MAGEDLVTTDATLMIAVDDVDFVVRVSLY